MIISPLSAKIAMNAASEGITIVDLSQKLNPVIYANTGFMGLTGYGRDEIIGRNCNFLQGPKTDPETVTAIRQAVSNRQRFSTELINYKKDGTAFWNRLSLSPFQEKGLDYMVGIQLDITAERALRESMAQDLLAHATVKVQLLQEKEKAERLLEANLATETRLKEQMTILNSIVEHLPVALFAKDAKDDYRWIMWNQCAETMFQLTKEQVLGKTDYDNFPKQESDSFRATDINVMASRAVVDIPEESVTSPRGTWFSHTIKIPIYDETGEPSVLLGICEDLEARKQAEVSENAKREAERANHAKSIFLSNMSHELRTPLNSIIGMTELLGESSLSDQDLGMVGVINQASASLLAIVNDILDLSKIEADLMTLDLVGIDLVSLIDRIIDTLKPLASKKNLLLSRHYETRDIPYVMADATRLSRVIINLAGNAIKYTDEGSVRFEVAHRPLSDTTIMLTLRIIDTGVGIAADLHATVFEKFTQVDHSPARRHGGSGLGLAITLELIEMMQGTIALESEPGKGSIFTVHLPLTIAETLHKDTAQAMDERNLSETCGIIPFQTAKILVAEDHALNQAFIRKLLQKYEIPRVDIVEDGAAALAALSTAKYDIVLMDCQMPVMNGYDAATNIRVLEEGTMQRIPIVAMTANAMAGDREKCMAAGMDDYLSKPIDAKKFRAVLGRWIKFPERTTEPNEQVPIDLSNMQRYSNGNKDEERHFVQLFFRQNDKALKVLQANCVGGKNISWTETAHLLKSGAASIGAAHLYTLCNEAQSQDDASQGERQYQLDAIHHEIGRIRKFLTSHGLIS